LSGGQQQRLAIARALMNKPDVILADEPVASLDPALAESITSLLVNIATESKRTLIVSLHAVDLARSFFQRIVALRDGQLAFDVNSNYLDQHIVNEVFLNASPNQRDRGQSDVKRWRRINCTC
jgi:phosphonate transport system ATP-binding protein